MFEANAVRLGTELIPKLKLLKKRCSFKSGTEESQGSNARPQAVHTHNVIMSFINCWLFSWLLTGLSKYFPLLLFEIHPIIHVPFNVSGLHATNFRSWMQHDATTAQNVCCGLCLCVCDSYTLHFITSNHIKHSDLNMYTILRNITCMCIYIYMM